MVCQLEDEANLFCMILKGPSKINRWRLCDELSIRTWVRFLAKRGAPGPWQGSKDLIDVIGFAWGQPPRWMAVWQGALPIHEMSCPPLRLVPEACRSAGDYMPALHMVEVL